MRPPSHLIAIAFASIFAVPALAQRTNTADAYLSRAQAILDAVPSDPTGAQLVSGNDKDNQERAAKTIAELKRDFAELMSAYRSSPDASSPVDWKTKFSEVERDLVKTIGGGTTAGAAMVAGPQAVTQATDSVASAAAGSNSTAPGTVGLVGGGSTAGSVGTAGTVGRMPASSSASGAATIGAPAAPGSATQGLVPTATGVVGVGEPAPPGSIASVPATGTPAAAGGDAQPNTAAVLIVVPATAPAPDTSVANVQDGATEVTAAMVSTIGIRELDARIRRQLEQFRLELELFYTAPVNERP